MFYADNFCTYTEDAEGYTFTGPCVITKEQYSVTVPKQALYHYRQGAFIQDAFPMLSKDDREFLMSGMSPAGWDKAFPPDEEEICDCNEAEESHTHCKHCDCVLNWSDDTGDEVCASCASISN